MIDSDRLRSFVAFGEELSFTRAAARLHLSQPALHVQVARLTDSLGVTLYRRRGRALELTHAGRALLAFGRDEARRTEAFLAGLGAASSGAAPVVRTVVLAAGEGSLRYVLGDAVRRISARRDVDLRVLTRDRDGVLAALRTGEAQVGVTALAAPPDDLRAVKARVAGMSLVVPRGHPLARKRRVRLRDLEGARLIVPPAGRPHREQIERAMAAAGVGWERAVEAAGWGVMLHYASLGVGLAIVNDICPTPRGTVARPLTELSPLAYYVLHRPTLGDDDPARSLAELAALAFRAT
jgi:LysR family transcriptional regulator, low CO2-responsive transcriptional regulator